MKRRNFILLASSGVAMLAIPTLVYLHEDNIDSLLFQPNSLANIWDTGTMNIIGLNYMIKVPKESKERVLVKRLMNSLSGEAGNLAITLEKQIKNDFIAGNTVMVDGWILSVTEARQCALLSLTLQKS